MTITKGTVLHISFVLSAMLLATYGCQKELPVPTDLPPTVFVKVPVDTITIRAFYGHQGLTPPNIGTVVFPQYAYEVPVVNKLAFMSAYTGLNGYGDSAGTIKKNAINEYNGEFYNTNVNAKGNAWVTITPINHPQSDLSTVSVEGNFAYDKFFKFHRQLAITIKLVNGMWEHKDTAANGKITIYQMAALLMTTTESVETGLATQNWVQKLKNGQSETYLTFVNQRGFILQPPKTLEGKPIAWYPHLYQ